jgi:hypothetical protein
MAGNPTSFRFSEDDTLLFEELEGQTGLSRLDVVRLALRLLQKTWQLAPAVGVRALAEAQEEVRRSRGRKKEG